MAINCTFVGNSAGSGGAICNQDYASAQVRNSIVWANLPNQVSAATAVTYSDVQGGCLGQGNIDIDPCFVDAGGSDYHLLPDSPCINAGDPGLVAGPNDVDMDGEARVMLGRVDMGADEFNPFAAEFVVVRRERVERTVFEYECEVVLENISRFAVKNVSLEMAKVSENMTIVDPEVNFSGAEIAARASARSVDTCTFRVDRAEAIDPAGIIWRVTAELTDTGAKMEHTLTSLLALDPPRSAAADFEGLAALADNWLWVGTPGGIDEDTIPDGRVNLADFARLAQQWGTD
jgi:predicted outer membrane repeat protein